MPKACRYKKENRDLTEHASRTWKYFLAGALFAAFVTPAFISYRPYSLSWDDADYLLRAVSASRAFWSGNFHGLGAAMVSWHAPAMTLLGLPWGPMTSRAAAGNCFLTLAAVIALIAASSLYMLLRIGVKPVFLILAAGCVGVSLGPYPPGLHAGSYDNHAIATGFMADSLLSWVTLAAVLPIAYEKSIACPSVKAAVVRGLLCASIMSAGVLTKVNFLYFLVLVTGVLFLTLLRNSGWPIAAAWLATFCFCCVPAAFYMVRYGGSAFAQAKAASFGGLANFYHVPLFSFFRATVAESPGLLVSTLLEGTVLVYLATAKRLKLSDINVWAFLIVLGFLIIVLAAPSKQSRYLFPVIVTLPFLLAVLMPAKAEPTAAPVAATVAALVFVGIVGAAVPTRQRINWQSLARADAVQEMAVNCKARNILLATDSPTLNVFLMNLDLDFSVPSISAGTLAYQAMNGIPIEEDLHTITQSDMIVFQDPRHTNPKFTNQRVSQYEQYVRQSNSDPIRVGDDITIYSGCLH